MEGMQHTEVLAFDLLLEKLQAVKDFYASADKQIRNKRW